MQITNNPTIILYLIITILISLTAIVSLTNMLLYPLSKPQKLFLFFGFQLLSWPEGDLKAFFAACRRGTSPFPEKIYNYYFSNG